MGPLAQGLKRQVSPSPLPAGREGFAGSNGPTEDGGLPSGRRNPVRSVGSGKDPGGPAQATDKGDQGSGHVGSSRSIYTDLVLDRRKWLVRSQKGVRKESR